MSEKIRAAAEKSTRDSFAMTVYGDGVRDGVRDERERVIGLLKANIHSEDGDCCDYDDWSLEAIALIKGETE